ncbi:LacI family DNA-binding transcriptional regulator [Roseomonas elaeocarpi]|uniref:LacI family DNA-binding transcriptional regulator n=1 Tax=Roseomonas elaeocarpi TaxID=907779 RepID=A0ABV6JM85_9PROT
MLKAAVTIHDVAKAAGVSIGTVSKVLNNQGRFTEETRIRVRQSAESLRFQPNALAQSLHQKRSYTVGLVSRDSFGRFSLPLLEGIENALDPARMAVFVCKPTDDPVHERRHIESLMAKRVDGLIVTSRRTDKRPPVDLAGTSMPVVYAYAQPEGSEAVCVLPDDRGGGQLAGQHLLCLGRTALAHVTGPEHFTAVRERRQGFEEALREAGRSLDPDWYLSGPWSEAWGHEAVGRLLEHGPRFDAIFCGSDQIARGVADALRERGLRVPEDVALVGYDNWDIIAAATRPPLTTIDPCLETLGQQAASCLLAMIAGAEATVPRVIRHPCRLVVRQSCGGEALL